MQRQSVKVGDVVCNCQYEHLAIVEIIGEDAIMEDGSRCSITHCLDFADHSYTHPTDEEVLRYRLDNPYLAEVEW
jgi:hypothetical protein